MKLFFFIILSIICFCCLFCTPASPKVQSTEHKDITISDTLFALYGDTLVYSFKCDSSFVQTHRCPCYDDADICTCFISPSDTIEFFFYSRIATLLPVDSFFDIRDRIIRKYSSDWNATVSDISIKKISSKADLITFEVNNAYLHYKYAEIWDHYHKFFARIIHKIRLNDEKAKQKYELFLKSFTYQIKPTKR